MDIIADRIEVGKVFKNTKHFCVFFTHSTSSAIFRSDINKEDPFRISDRELDVIILYCQYLVVNIINKLLSRTSEPIQDWVNLITILRNNVHAFILIYSSIKFKI